MLLLATAGYRSWRDLATARGHVSELRGNITDSGKRIEHLRDLIERVENDPLTLERLAREDLGLIRPGDVVIVLPETPTARQSPSVP